MTGDFSSGKAPAVSLIFPCYNESVRLPASLLAARDFLASHFEEFEILVVDDGSTDDTAGAARTAAGDDPRIRVLRYEPNQGKGHAVAYGAVRASGEAILFSDADLSTPIEELSRFLPLLEEGADIVIGSRALTASRLEVRQPWWRERAGRAMNRLIRLLSGLEFVDTQCGFKLFTRSAAHTIFPQLQVKTWMFDVEVLVIARKLGYAIREMPVVWRNSGDSRVKASHIFRILRELILIRLYWLRRRPRQTSEAEVSSGPVPS